MLKFTQDHEWIRLEADGSATVGITQYAQEQLGDVVFVELPALGKEVAKGGDAAVVESVKAASEVYAPASGKVVAVNDKLTAKGGSGAGYTFALASGSSLPAGLTLTSAGAVSAIGNRRAFRVGQESLDLFRRYASVYAREQAYCHFSPALIANLERNWDAHNRKI